ncbi:MAG: hypothetical protein Q9167_001971 [Letrouitia subvulpina]
MEHPSPSSYNFFDDILQPHGQFSTAAEDTQLRIPVKWLEGRKNWPEQLERRLTKFMDENDFLHHRQTKEESNQKLNAVTQILRGFFEQTNWKAEYDEKLKQKIRNKMHRIRPQIKRMRLDTTRDGLASFKEAYVKLPPHVYQEALRAFAFHIGKDNAVDFVSRLNEGKGSSP